MTRTEIAGMKLALCLFSFLLVYGFMFAQADYWREVKAAKADYKMRLERDRALDSIYAPVKPKPLKSAVKTAGLNNAGNFASDNRKKGSFMQYSEAIKIISESPTQHFFVDGIKKRLFTNKGIIAEYKKGAKRRGYIIDDDVVTGWNKLEALPEKDKRKVWESNLEKLIERLEKSGFWKDMLEQARLLKKAGYEIIVAYKAVDYNKIYDARIAEQASILEGSGIKYICDWMLDIRIKKMEYPQGFRAYEAEAMAKAIAEGKDYSIDRFTGKNYDISMNYKENSSKHGRCGWYSEEYRGCGNGHYYLMLDATHALYYEKD